MWTENVEKCVDRVNIFPRWRSRRSHDRRPCPPARGGQSHHLVRLLTPSPCPAAAVPGWPREPSSRAVRARCTPEPTTLSLRIGRLGAREPHVIRVSDAFEGICARRRPKVLQLPLGSVGDNHPANSLHVGRYMIGGAQGSVPRACRDGPRPCGRRSGAPRPSTS